MMLTELRVSRLAFICVYISMIITSSSSQNGKEGTQKPKTKFSISVFLPGSELSPNHVIYAAGERVPDDQRKSYLDRQKKQGSRLEISNDNEIGEWRAYFEEPLNSTG